MRSYHRIYASLAIFLLIGVAFSTSLGTFGYKKAARAGKATANPLAAHNHGTETGTEGSGLQAQSRADARRRGTLVVKDQPFGPLRLNVVQLEPKQMDHTGHGMTVDTSLDALLKTPILVSTTFKSSMNRLSNKSSAPVATSSSRPAQIVDVAVSPGGTFAFVPNQVNINVGDTVRWTFAEVGHNVVSGAFCFADNIFCSPNNMNCPTTPTSPSGAVYTRVFNQAGTFDYFCSPHCLNEMVGRIVVNAVPTDPAVSCDFDGDRKTDVSVFRPSNGTWYALRSTNNGLFAQAFGTNGDRPAPADYDGDGKIDVAVFRPSSGTFYILLSLTGAVRAEQFGANGDFPMPGDYDGDLKADVAVYRPSNGTWYRLNSSNGAFHAQSWGTGADKPSLGDFDGDGKTDFAVFRPSDGTWYILKSLGGVRADQFGAASDTPVAADYDGDSKADIAVFRPPNGTWYIIQSSNSAFRAHAFGVSTDRPALGDYDGDEKADVAVFRASEGTFYILQSQSGGFRAQPWGTDGDLAAPASFVP